MTGKEPEIFRMFLKESPFTENPTQNSMVWVTELKTKTSPGLTAQGLEQAALQHAWRPSMPLFLTLLSPLLAELQSKQKWAT